MTCIRIKQMEDRIATSGLHLGGPPTRRRLEPGEVVDIPDDLDMDDGENLFDALWATGKVELTPEFPSRPFEYTSVAEAKMCAPGFKPLDEAEEIAMNKARAKVAERLAEQFPAEAAPKPRKPAKKKAAAKGGNRRAMRRQLLEGSGASEQTANAG